MNVAGVILSTGPESRISHSGRSSRPRTEVLARAALDATLAEVVVVVADQKRAELLPEGVTILLDEGGSQASALRCAVDWCMREGHEAIVCTTIDRQAPGLDIALTPDTWRALALSTLGPLVVATKYGRHCEIFRVDADIWPALPLDGVVARALDSKIELLRELEIVDPLAEKAPDPAPITPKLFQDDEVSALDMQKVRDLLGREPSGAFAVVVRDGAGDPVVIRNAPFLFDGTPMPTRYWLVGRREQEAVGRLESSGGVRLLESLFDPALIEATHARYASERDALIDASHIGPRPTGGVGGTRRGLKCLHAHLAWYLAGGGDPVGRHVAHLLADELNGSVASIDCGTNSTRLLVLDRDGSVLEREMTITRLGQGVDTTKVLADDAIERTLETLRRYREILDRHGVVRVRATTTSAARDATNREQLFGGAKTILGVDLELLAGEEEGRLSYLGATAGLEGTSDPWLVVDVGGGSTEFIAGSTATTQENNDVASLNIGCVRVTERFLHSDPPTRAELETARSAVKKMIEDLQVQMPGLCVPDRCIGVAGTLATLATRSQGLLTYEGAKTHGTGVSREFVDAELARLSRMTVTELRQLPGIDPARADVIVGGVLVVQQVLELFGFKELMYSETDILDGVAMSLLRS
ncbi:MAG TPA: DUF501 domain-containing protein [Acidimicrobiales bacterium]|nr:DUF501 domain-containing protein [Acidimicrobiales bacterium]